MIQGQVKVISAALQGFPVRGGVRLCSAWGARSSKMMQRSPPPFPLAPSCSATLCIARTDNPQINGFTKVSCSQCWILKIPKNRIRLTLGEAQVQGLANNLVLPPHPRLTLYLCNCPNRASMCETGEQLSKSSSTLMRCCKVMRSGEGGGAGHCHAPPSPHRTPPNPTPFHHDSTQTNNSIHRSST